MSNTYYTKDNGRVLHSSKEITEGSGTILVVDDDPTIRVITQAILTAIGYTVILAVDGVEAVNIYRNNYTDIDLVIMDMMMPVMKGREAFKKMKECNPKVKVIIISGIVARDSIRDLFDDGIYGFVEKPFEVPALSYLVKDVIDCKV